MYDSVNIHRTCTPYMCDVQVLRRTCTAYAVHVRPCKHRFTLHWIQQHCSWCRHSLCVDKRIQIDHL